MAGGWTRDGAVQDQIDDTVRDAVIGARARLPVGEGVSRPFVYETPGRPESGAGTRRRQPGQVRLRRYLVTEVVTDTEAGQRHEVRVQSEPVSDAEVDAVRTPPDRQDEPIGQGPNRPRHNDWFSDEATHGTEPAS